MYIILLICTIGATVSSTFPITVTPKFTHCTFPTDCVAKTISCFYGDTVEWLDPNFEMVSGDNHSRIYGMYIRLLSVPSTC